MEDEELKKYDPWEDKEFLDELDRRVKELESGEVQGIPWEEVKRKSKEYLKKPGN
jgi:putative addiction module component (TIGR02574 family)